MYNVLKLVCLLKMKNAVSPYFICQYLKILFKQLKTQIILPHALRLSSH